MPAIQNALEFLRRRSQPLSWTLSMAYTTAAIALVLVYLRPMAQFIYFQF